MEKFTKTLRSFSQLAKLTAVLALLLMGHRGEAQAANALKADSIYTFAHVQQIHLQHPDSALHVLQRMDDRHLAKDFLIDAFRSMVYGADRRHQLAMQFAHKAMAVDSLRNYPHLYLETMMCCVNAYRHLDKHRACVKLLNKGITFARVRGITMSEANFIFTLGQIHYLLGNRYEAFNSMREAIRKCEANGSDALKPNQTYFYRHLGNTLIEEGRYKEAMEVLLKREALIEEMKRIQTLPAGYIDQQLALLYSEKAFLYSKLGKKQKASETFVKFMATEASAQPGYWEYVVPYWLSSQEYMKVILYYTQHAPADSLSAANARRLKQMAEAYHGLGRNDQAYVYQKEYAKLADSLHVRSQLGRVSELTADLELKEKEWAIHQQKKQIEHDITVRNLLLAGLIVTCLLLWSILYYMRALKKKNKVMAEHLQAMLSYESQIHALEHQLEDKEVTRPLATAETEGSEEAGNDEADLLLYKRIEKLLKEEKMYLLPELNRQQLLDKLQVDKNSYSRVMQLYVKKTLPQYLTELRIRHALELFKAYPNYTVQAIAQESGFNNLRHFQRQFKIVTGMTPSEYKATML